MQEDRYVLRRRIALVAIAVLIIVPVYVLFIRDDDSSPSESEVRSAVTDPNKAAEVLLDRVNDPQQGIVIRFPNGWKGETDKQVVRAKSANGRTVVAVTTGGRADQAADVFKTAVKGIASSYRKPRVSFIPSKKQQPIGELPAAGAVVSGQLKGGAGATTLVYVARGKTRAYIVTAIIPADGGDLQTANLVLTQGLILSS